VRSNYGYAAVQLVYGNENGNITRADYLGMDGKPVRSKDGYAGRTAKYNDNARLSTNPILIQTGKQY